MTNVVNISDVLEGHVSLDVACIDRLHLNAYVPTLQVGGQVNQFCRHLGQPIASPAVIEKIGNRFRRDIDAFAKADSVPVLNLAKPDRSRWDDRKLDHVGPTLKPRSEPGAMAWSPSWRPKSSNGCSALRKGPRAPGSFSTGTRPSAGSAATTSTSTTGSWARLYQNLHLLRVPGQGVAQRARAPRGAMNMWGNERAPPQGCRSSLVKQRAA